MFLVCIHKITQIDIYFNEMWNDDILPTFLNFLGPWPPGNESSPQWVENG